MATWEEQTSAYLSGHQSGSPLTYEQWLSNYLATNVGVYRHPVKIRYTYPPPGPGNALDAAGIMQLATLAMDLTLNTGRLSGATSSATSLLTVTRAGTANMDNVAGIWSAVGANTARISDKGLLVEEARTNVCLWNRDLTNVAWVKTTATAAKDQTGVDGVALSASSLTATAGNATCLQTITLGSAARFQSAFVKRLSGSGTIQMTMDNGTTWTAVTVTAAWTRVSIPTQTLANPVVGLRIVTSGDAVAVDMVQNENGAFITSPVTATTVAVARAADSIDVASFTPTLPASLFAEALYPTLGGASFGMLYIHGASGNTDQAGLFYSGSTLTTGAGCTVASTSQFNLSVAGTATLNVPAKIAAGFASNDFAVVRDGGTVATDVAGTVLTGVKIAVGRVNIGSGFANCYIRKAAYWNSRLINSQLQTITA